MLMVVSSTFRVVANMGWWNHLVRMQALGFDMNVTETEYDGMWCEEFSEPLTDWDYESEQP